MRRSVGGRRVAVLLAAALAVGLVALGGAVWWAVREPAGVPAARGVPAADRSDGSGRSDRSVPRVPAAVGVLRDWDGRRAGAWARGDVAALRRLYTPASRTGRADVAMLRAYTRRGLRVTGLRQQLLGVRVLARLPGELRLAVTDRLAAATAVGPGLVRPLPTGEAHRRIVVLVRRSGTWRVAEVRAG